jgi:toxin YhaV
LRIDVRNGWTLYYHPAFAAQLDLLTDEVARLKQGPDREQHPKTKLLDRILRLVLQEIPRDPGAPEFRLGKTLGKGYGHWRRAKFMGRFRLFFRFSSKVKAIIYAWVNDENTMRKADSVTDPYAIFKNRLLRDEPPDDWADLLRASQ